MKKIIRFISLVLVFAVILTVFTGCHEKRAAKEFSVPGELDETRNIEISFWAKNDTNKTQTAIYNKAIDDFHSLYPNITVNMRLYTDYTKIYNDVITNISTDTTPNVCITYPDHIATYLTGADTVVPLDGLMENEKYGLGGSALKFDSPSKDGIIEKFLNEGVFSGHYYALPFMRSTEACYVNRTYVEKLGFELPGILTWDFMWEVAEKAMEQDADGNYLVNGQKIMIPVIYKSTDNMMIQMLKQKGIGYSDDDGNVLLFNDETKELLLDIAEKTEKKLFSTFKISSYPANFLNAGQCIFAIDSTAGATWMGSKAPLIDISPDKLIDFETEVMTVPQFDTSSPVMISQGPSVCVFNKKDSQEVLAAWLFAQFLLTDGVQTAYSGTEGYAPVTQQARDTDEYKTYLSLCGADGTEHYDVKIKATQLLLDNVDNTFVTPVFNGSASLRNAAGELIEDVTKSVRRKASVDGEYIESLYSKMNSLYRLDSTGSASGTREDLGPLPSTSVILLVSLAAVWCFIGIYVLIDSVKNRKKQTK